MNEPETSTTIQTTPCPICLLCGKQFVFASFDRLYHNLVPDLCPVCRKKIAAKKRQEREEHENAKWQETKKKQQEQFEQLLKNYTVVPMEEINPCGDVLYILGNGFDMMHGVRSSYYNFRDSMGKNNNLRQTLETFWTPEDIWADFEAALAKFNMRAMGSNFSVDTHLDIAGAYDKDAGMAEFYMAVEMAADPITTVATELPKRFRKWIESLTIGTDDRPLQSIFRNGRVLCFNYTEFVESLYGIPHDQVCYLHGCRTSKKDTLILGHMPGSSDPMYELGDDSMPTRSKRKQYLISAAQENVYHLVADSDEDLTKHCDQIIEAHQDFFSSLQNIRTIIVIGHSMSPVDMDYFTELVRHLENRDTVHWYVGCHGLRDLESLAAMQQQLSLHPEQVSIFRTDKISVSLKQANAENQVKINYRKEHLCGTSPSKAWKVTTDGNALKIYARSDETANCEIIFSQAIERVVFSPDETHMFAVVRGLYTGIFLFTCENSTWHFANELQSIPHQSLLNPRLCHIYLEESTVTFVYNSRIRVYSLTDGSLTMNQARRYMNGYTYQGRDIKELFLGRKGKR